MAKLIMFGGAEMITNWRSPRLEIWQVDKKIAEFSDVPITEIGEVFLADGNAGAVTFVDDNDNAIDVDTVGFDIFSRCRHISLRIAKLGSSKATQFQGVGP